MLKVEFMTPSGPVYTGEATAVQAPGIEGLFTILQNHAPYISTLGKGRVKISTPGGEQIYEVSGGVVEVLKNQVSLLTESAKPV
jgi:F-type H+-transporting ATPase subunit epsilon